ncbi:MAG: hypothetical protein DBY32_09305 [Phascolarctobacterium sp.]|nr:MAG: hypothetical protein DBY32_09305 [Phascolarctobacterium sp.]
MYCILAIIFAFFFLRILYYGLIELKKECILWKIFWILTSLIQLLLALHFAEIINLKILINKYMYMAYIYIGLVGLSFFIGGTIMAKNCEDKERQEKIYIGLLITFISSLLYIYQKI